MYAPRTTNAPEPPQDTRYDYKYEYKYTNGKIAEILVDNSGEQLTRTVYNWTNDQVEALIYSSDGKLNQKFLRTYDKSGNEVASFIPDLGPGKHYGDKRFVTRYDSFDKAGNWTKNTVVIYKVLDDGTEIQGSSYITYRTITYYN